MGGSNPIDRALDYARQQEQNPVRLSNPGMWGWMDDIAAQGWGPAPMSMAAQSQNAWLEKFAGPRPGSTGQDQGQSQMTAQQPQEQRRPAGERAAENASLAQATGLAPATAAQGAGMNSAFQYDPNRRRARQAGLLSSNSMRGLLGV